MEEEEVPAVEEEAPSLGEFPPVEEEESATTSVSKIVDTNNTENVDGETSGYRLKDYLTVHFYLLGMPRMFSVRKSLFERYT